MGDVLASGGVEGRGRLRKARWSCQTSVDPGIPELIYAESIGVYGERGELKHLSSRRQKKETSISLVAASEQEAAQTAGVFPCGVVGPSTWELPSDLLAELSGQADHRG